MQGKLTYLGIIKMAMAFALQGYASQEEVDALVDTSMTVFSGMLFVAGMIEAVYGRYRIQRARY